MGTSAFDAVCFCGGIRGYLLFPPQTRYQPKLIPPATPPHPSASRPPSPQGEGMRSRHFITKHILFTTAKLLARSTNKLFCGAPRRGTKAPPGGINGFNAVKARWDGIERIQEVSESPAQLDFAALQSFSAPAPPNYRRRTTQKHTTSKEQRTTPLQL